MITLSYWNLAAIFGMGISAGILLNMVMTHFDEDDK